MGIQSLSLNIKVLSIFLYFFHNIYNLKLHRKIFILDLIIAFFFYILKFMNPHKPDWLHVTKCGWLSQ